MPPPPKFPPPKNTVLKRVVYEPFGEPSTAPQQSQKARDKATYQLILASIDGLLSTTKNLSRKKQIVFNLKKLAPFITPLEDDSGLFVYNHDLSRSISSLYVLLQYFLFADQAPKAQPPDGKKFFLLLKKAQFPANLLTMMHK